MSVGVLDPVVPVPPPTPPVPRKRRWPLVLVVLLVVAAIVGSLTWWYGGGDRLQPGSFGMTSSARPGQWTHVGIPLEVSGGHVTLVSARPIEPRGEAQFEFAVLRAGPGNTGLLGSAVGSTLASLGYHPFGVRGADVRAANPAVELVISVRGGGTGVVRVAGVEITYRSGPRTRHARADVSVCVGIGATVAQQGGCGAG